MIIALEIISVAAAAGAPTNNNNKIVIFQYCAPFTDCKSKMNNMLVDNAKDIEVVMPMYNLIEYSDNYSKTSGSLWQYYRDKAVLCNVDVITDFTADDNSHSFKFKQQLTCKIGSISLINVKIIVSL